MSAVMPCPICGSPEGHLFLSRPGVPAHQNSVFSTEDSARTLSRGDLSLVVCRTCGFVYNQAFDLGKLSYEKEYDNTQSCSPYFDSYLDSHIARILDGGERGRRIVEVGCGKGAFLRKLVVGDQSARGWGFDPSYVGPDADLDGRLSFVRQFFDGAVGAATEVNADVVVCRHVIEHVPSPVALLRSIHGALKPGARLYFETPCIDWILENRVVWDLFYEHCSYFTAASLRTAFLVAGFSVDSVEHVFGGQYLWLEASCVDVPPAVDFQPGATEALARNFSTVESSLQTHLTARIDKLRERGGVALWGAGAKGVTLANLVDVDRRRLACVVDINPRKQGNYVPGTGHPIVPPDALDRHDVCTVLLMNSNYRHEVDAQLRAAHQRATIELAEGE